MRAWSYSTDISPREGEPVFLAIARAIREDVRRGRLVGGAPVPSSRELSRLLGVHRNTVLAAYRELLAEGWIETSPARGTFVSQQLPEAQNVIATTVARGARLGFSLPRIFVPEAATADPPGSISLSGGVPDTRLIPHDVLARAFRRAMRARERTPRPHDPLGYGSASGQLRLRKALADLLREARGIPVTEERVLVTRGSQMAIDLFARAMLEPGDVVAVEHLGYRPAWAAFRLARAELVSVPVDAEGIDTNALAALVKRTRIRAVYVTPHHQYPTTVTLSPARRMELLALAARHRFAILEDDYDHEFHYLGRPVLPLASADIAGVVVYVSTLSKVLAPGLRLGFVAAPLPMIERMACLRSACDRQGDHVLERAVAELIEDGELARHIRKVRRAYAARAASMTALLRETFPAVLSFEEPRGGTAVWTTVAPHVNLEAWVQRARDRGVILHPATRFAFAATSRVPRALRIGFAHLDTSEQREAVRRMKRAYSS